MMFFLFQFPRLLVYGPQLRAAATDLEMQDQTGMLLAAELWPQGQVMSPEKYQICTPVSTMQRSASAARPTSTTTASRPERFIT